MPTIELTDEQAEELIDLLESEIQFIAGTTADDDGERPDPDAILLQHMAGVYADILHLLEIA
jgi:hypothetical protein